MFVDGVNHHFSIFRYGGRNEPFYPRNGGGTVWFDVHCKKKLTRGGEKVDTTRSKEELNGWNG